MNMLIVLVPFALLLGLFFVGTFIWAVKNGQYDDLDSPSQRMLFEDNQKVITTINNEEIHE